MANFWYDIKDQVFSWMGMAAVIAGLLMGIMGYGAHVSDGMPILPFWIITMIVIPFLVIFTSVMSGENAFAHSTLPGFLCVMAVGLLMFAIVVYGIGPAISWNYGPSATLPLLEG